MPELRWILGLIGVVVVAALYVWGRRRAGSRDSRRGADRVEPMIDGAAASESEIQTPVLRTGTEAWSADSQIEIRTESGPEEEAVRGTDSGEPGGEGDSQGKILVLYIRAASGEDFKGSQLLEAFEEEGLKFGKLGAFHQYDESGNSLFSVANMHEPGSFAPDQMDEFETGGVIAFMVLREDGNMDSLSRMIATARRLASILGGEVLDETGSTLTNQLATHMKEQAIEYLRRIRLEAADSTGSWRS
jgi:cell division protein ZipA